MQLSESGPAGQLVPQADGARKKKKSLYFFVRRRPRLKGVPRDWTRPSSEAKYAEALEQEGFVSASLVNRPLSEALLADLRELEQHLMTHFWQLDQEARYCQNLHYLYQWVFILSAFLTTALSATAVFIHTSDADVSLGIIRLTGLLGLVTAVISGVAAAVSYLSANQTPQQRWFKRRSQVEGLRSLYFLFLARARPFDAPDNGERVRQLRLKVLDILRDQK